MSDKGRVCSKCGSDKYYPNCGAKMDGGKNDG
jgi:hypothetical protein